MSKLAADSTRDTQWQLAEYRRLMGSEAAERQEVKKGCSCIPRKVRVGESKRIVHERGCKRFKEWMGEHQFDPVTSASAAAHAAAIRGDV